MKAQKSQRRLPRSGTAGDAEEEVMEPRSLVAWGVRPGASATWLADRDEAVDPIIEQPGYQTTPDVAAPLTGSCSNALACLITCDCCEHRDEDAEISADEPLGPMESPSRH